MIMSLDTQFDLNTTVEYTKGLPRDVIKVADDVLRHLMAHNKKQITIAEIEAIIQENNLTKAPADS